MNSNEYLDASARTNPDVVPGLHTQGDDGNFDKSPTYLMSKHQLELLHASMGMVTEAAEFMDQMKRHVIYGAELDHTNLKEELGDMLWYIALAMRVTGTDFEAEMTRNIEKLKKRFPDKFTTDKALNRDLDVERETLEAHNEVAHHPV